MKKQISFSTGGQRADIGDIVIYRMLPNRYAETVGPFVFLDYIAPVTHEVDEPKMRAGTGAHPHRGIATLTYILNGEGEHFDSRGNHAIVRSGGAQWMNAGNGIVHDESFNIDSQTNSRLTHGFQFWINLPAKIKTEAPEYLPVQSAEMPKKELPDGKGWIKLISGEYEDLVSKIPAYSKQFLYHIHLEPGRQFSLETENELEYAAILPANEATINDTHFPGSEFIEFDRTGGTIEIVNSNKEAGMDILIFGGERYTEPIVAEGPFVMNTHAEIAEAYRDFHLGKYGKITYERNKEIA
jgi:redox-sensitive bicupin YhaK (pirin superfamily)